MKIRYIKSKISSLSINSRQFFNFTNNLTGRKQKPSLPNLPKEIICYEFIKYFHDKITSVCEYIKSEKNKFGNKLNPLASIFIPYSDSNLTYSFNSFNMTSTMEVYQLITSLTSTSPSDSIPISLIKKLAPILAPYYCSIVNFSLYSSIFPDVFKHAEITPLLKKKTNLDCNKLSNYRPISQLPLLSKIIEKIVCRQIIEYLLFHNLFDEYQNAYRPGHSTETTLLKISDDILKYLDNSDSVQLILLDLSCAFDSLDHSIIIDRIKSIGFTGSSLDWIISYLSNRTYSINIKNYIHLLENYGMEYHKALFWAPFYFLYILFLFL